jgi:exopolysaccharide biosynthesis polyprenyl glycosylphosphotransferase
MRSTLLPVHVRRARRRRLTAASLLAADAIATVLGFVVAYWLRYDLEIGREVISYTPLSSFMPTIVLLLISLVTLLWSRGAYRQPRSASWLAQLGPVGSSVVTAIGFTIIVTFLYKPDFFSRLIFFYAGALVFVLLALTRYVMVRWRRSNWQRGQRLERMLVVGGTGLSHQAMSNLANSTTTGYELVGYVADPLGPDAPPPRFRHPPSAPHLGPLDVLPAAVVHHQIDQIVVALPFWQHRDLPKVVQTCTQLGIDFQVVPDFYELSFDGVTVQDVGGTPLIELRNNQIIGTNYVLKRLLDLSLVLITLPLWGMLSLVIGLAVRLTSSGPVILRQTRIGRHGRPFEFLKFRTMVVNADELRDTVLAQGERDGPLFKIKNDPRVTPVGRFLRKFSLDEIPQFWNVLRGDISLVGPRPAIPEEVFRYEPWQRRRLDVMPGITGLAQAMGRSEISFEEMVRLDIYYAEHWSVWLDIRILLATIPTVLSGRGAY